MSVVIGEQQYQFYNVDQVFDYLVSLKMKPVVELSFMPSHLVKCGGSNQKSCDYAFGDHGGYKGWFVVRIGGGGADSCRVSRGNSLGVSQLGVAACSYRTDNAARRLQRVVRLVGKGCYSSSPWALASPISVAVAPQGQAWVVSTHL